MDDWDEWVPLPRLACRPALNGYPDDLVAAQARRGTLQVDLALHRSLADTPTA